MGSVVSDLVIIEPSWVLLLLCEDFFNHFKLLVLASNGQRELLNEFNEFRDLVVRDLAVAEFIDVLAFKRHSFFETSKAEGFFAVLHVWDSDDLDILDRLMSTKVFFDFPRTDYEKAKVNLLIHVNNVKEEITLGRCFRLLG